MSDDPPAGRPPRPSRRGFLSLLGTGAVASLAGCGYRPGGGDVRWRSNGLRGVFRITEVDVAGDVLYTITRQDTTFDFESEEWLRGGRVTAYRTTDGSRRWSEQFESPLDAHAVDDGGVAVAFDRTVVRLGPDGREWTASVDGPTASLGVTDERVYVRTADHAIVALAGGERLGSTSIHGADGRDVDDSGSDDDGADGRSGDAEAGVESPEGGAPGAEPGADRPRDTDRGNFAVSEDIIVTDDGTGIAAFDADGTRRWRRGDVAASHLTVAADGVFAVTDRRLLALDGESGETRWRTGPPGVAPAPVVTDDAVYYAPGPLVAFDHDGERRWSTDGVDAIGGDEPVAADLSGAYAVEHSSLTAFDRDGTREWTVEHDSVDAGPFLTDDGVLVVAEGELVCHVR